jgi:hypothetical protein
MRLDTDSVSIGYNRITKAQKSTNAINATTSSNITLPDILPLF